MASDVRHVESVRMALAELAPADYNPRKISAKAMAGLKASLTRFGELGGIVYNKRTGHLVGGHQRVKALLALGETHAEVRVVDLPISEEKAANLALNHHGIGGEWDDALLAVVLDDVKRDLPTAFEELQLADIIADAGLADDAADGGTDGLTDPDDVPEELPDPVTRAGDVWVMGAHRIICGDSTDDATAASAMDGMQCDSLMFDPPWDAGLGVPRGAWKNTIAMCDGQRAGDVVRLFGAPAWVFVWDCGACWYTPGRPLKRTKLALWFGDVKSYNYDGAHYGDPGEAKTASNSRGTYEYVPDPRGKHLSDLFAKQLSSMHASGEHRHEKPCDWVRMLIGCCTTGDLFDPFAGSGVSVIACEQLGRRCAAIELSPDHVDAAVRRWEMFTGKDATLDGDGRTFAEIAAERASDGAAK